jgi:amino acid transporter
MARGPLVPAASGMTQTTRDPARKGLATPSRPKWQWFVGWLFAGASYGGVLAAAFADGILLLPIAAFGTIILTRHGREQGIPGLFSGLALAPLAVAYLNRDGPGDVCTKTPGGDACVDNFNPLPWLIIGLVLLIAGFVWFVHRRRVAASA